MEPFDTVVTVSDLHMIPDTDPKTVRVTAAGAWAQITFEREIQDVPQFGAMLRVTVQPFRKE